MQDAIQDTFCRYLEKKPEFRDEEHEKAWLIRVAANICRDMIRFRIRHPKVSIDEVENTLAAPEGTLCYIRAPDVFNLPAQEMTDEEMLQIIDFQHKKSYAVAHGPQAQAAAVESGEKEKRLQKTLEETGGRIGLFGSRVCE